MTTPPTTSKPTLTIEGTRSGLLRALEQMEAQDRARERANQALEQDEAQAAPLEAEKPPTLLEEESEP